MLLSSCAILDKTRYFKTSSKKWKLHTEYCSLILFADPQRWDQRSYTYKGENGKTVLYPHVQHMEFLWTPVFIPCIPGLSPLSTSGKYDRFKIIIRQNSDIAPDNMMCFIGDRQIYPSSIQFGVMSTKTKEVFWYPYWKRKDKLQAENQSINFQKPENWGEFTSPMSFFTERQIMELSDIDKYSQELQNILIEGAYNKDFTAFYYWCQYDIQQSDINEIEIRFKDNSAESLLLKRKKGLQYSFVWYLFPVYR